MGVMHPSDDVLQLKRYILRLESALMKSEANLEDALMRLHSLQRFQKLDEIARKKTAGFYQGFEI